MAELVGSDMADGSGYWTVDSYSGYWRKAWITNFKDDAGSKVYVPLPTAFPVNTFNKPSAAGHRYSGSFEFLPLLTYPTISFDDTGNEVISVSKPETYEAEMVLYKAMIYPSYPLMLGSSISAHNHYGPVFATTAKISTSGTNKLSPVQINISFEGGKALMVPPFNVTAPDLALIDPQLPDGTIASAGTTSTNGVSEEAVYDYYPYRSCNLMDCLALANLYSSVDEMLVDAATLVEATRESPDYRIVSMELEIRQEYEYKYPVPTNGRTDQNGPRFASLKNRVVQGSFVYWSQNEELVFDNTGPLTMYFGSFWFFPMPNVEWQKPTVDAAAGQGYMQTYGFIARTSPYAIQKGFVSGAENYPISEFWISSNDISQNASGSTEENE
jgi:hypothetical protein